MTNNQQCHIFVGGQFGSEAKGHACDQFIRNALNDQQRQDLIAVRVAGPNAGHTVVHQPTGDHVALRCIPVAVISDPECLLVVAPGSEVDLDVLRDEARMLEDDYGFDRSRLWIHEQATILTADYREREGGNDGPMQQRIGSTGKGIGVARAERIMRRALIVKDAELDLHDEGYQVLTEKAWRYWLGAEDAPDRTVVIEGTQGYGLGLHAGFYPFCTSSDCRSVDFVAMAGVPLADYHVTTHVVYRTFPIRVAGNSGPLAHERDWAELAERTDGYIKPEKTTVTKKIRRIGGWDGNLAKAAFQANRLSFDTRPWLMFADYVDPSLAGCTDVERLWDSDQLRSFMVQASEAWEGSGDTWPYFVATGANSGVFMPWKR